MKIAKRIIIPVVIICVLAIIGCAIYFSMVPYMKKQDDLERLQTEDYNSVFLSMFPVDNYAEEDFLNIRGYEIVVCQYAVPDAETLLLYLETIEEAGNIIDVFYLGIDPEKISVDDLEDIIWKYPDTQFEMVLAAPQIEHWLEMEDGVWEDTLQNYGLLTENFIGVPNVRLYFFSGDEWLICNKENYEKEYLLNSEISYFLMCNMDELHEYCILTEKQLEEEMEEMQELILEYREEPIEYPDGKGYDIVFLGDSIIGNYTDSSSIPGVVKALSGADVYNCGYGGKSASSHPDEVCSVVDIVDALIEKDLSKLPQEAQVYQGAYEFINSRHKSDKLMFVINFGLNDYFNGAPIETEDEYDLASFKGALRSMVMRLKEAYPEAVIILNTPNYTVYYDYGEGIQSAVGGRMDDYVEAVIDVAEEMDVELLDNYNELPITPENWQRYESDGCHLNEIGRFLVGSRIALRIPDEVDD